MKQNASTTGSGAFVAIAAIFLAMVSSSCVLINIGGITGSGIQETRTFPEYAGIASIEATDAIDITVVKGPKDSVEVTMSDNLFEYFKMSMTGSTLKVGGYTEVVCSSAKPLVKVTMKGDIASFSANNASKASLSDFSPASLAVSSDNASSVTVTGSSCGSVWLNVSNASKADLSGLIASADSAVTVSSASEASVTCDGSITGSVTSASTLIWSGKGSWKGSSSGASAVRYR